MNNSSRVNSFHFWVRSRLKHIQRCKIKKIETAWWLEGKSRKASIVSITKQLFRLPLGCWSAKVLLKQITASHMTAGMKAHPWPVCLPHAECFLQLLMKLEHLVSPCWHALSSHTPFCFSHCLLDYWLLVTYLLVPLPVLPWRMHTVGQVFSFS